jgi:hypothetical protein
MKINSLADMFQLLSAARDPKFVFEPELRLFQLKVWLLSSGKDSKSLNDSAVLFTSIMFRRRIGLDHRQLPGATPSELMDTVFENEIYRELYDVAFPFPLTPYTLSLKLSLGALRSGFGKSQEEIDHLNLLTEIRLRLHAGGHSYSLNEARYLDAKQKKGMRTKFGRTNLSKVRHARQTREAFLFVAKHHQPGLLKFESKVGPLPKELHEEVTDRERFKKLFGRAITALEVLKPKGLTAEQLRDWTQLDPIPLDDVIKPFSKAEFEKVGYTPKLRRIAAVTTHAGKRQAPVGRVNKF